MYYYTQKHAQLTTETEVCLEYYESSNHALLSGWTGIIFIRVYVSDCVCVRLYIDYLKKFLTDFDETWQDNL